MKPITPQQIVHLRLLSALPVRTHYAPEYVPQGGNVHYVTPMQATERWKRIKAMKKEGKTPREIADAEGCSIVTVYTHLRTR